MKFQIDTLDVPQAVNDFLDKEGIVWDVFPGVGMLEKEINSLEDLYDFMERCEIASSEALSFNIQPMSSKFAETKGVVFLGGRPENEEPMIYMTVAKAKLLGN